MSPAFNINLSSVIFSSLISGTAGEAGAEYKLTIKDDNLEISLGKITKEETNVTVPYTVTGASDASAHDQISVVITDGTWTDNGWSNGADLLQYGKLTVTDVETDENVTTGTGTFTLDTTNVTGTWGSDYHVYILAEDVNGEFETDYASAPVEIKAITASATGYDSTYDGQAHGITVSVSDPESGATVKYGESADSCTLDASPTITNAGDSPKTIYYQVEADGYLTLAGSEIVTISGIPIFSGHQLVLSGQIGVKFGMNLSMLSDAEKDGSYMEFTINGRTTRVNTSDATVADDGRYIYACFVTSIQMAETITAVFHYNDETVEQTYSVKDYIDYIDEHSTEYTAETVNLVQAIADYGHYVQPFLSATNNWTIGTDYAEMSTCFATTYDLNNIKDNVSNHQLSLAKGSSKVDTAYMRLTLDSETTLNVRLTVEDDTELSASASFHGNTYNAVKQSDGTYIIKITNIPAAWLGDKVTITGTAGGEFTVEVSALSYVYSVVNSDTMNQDAKNAVASLYYYYTTTEAYRTANN